VCPTLHWNHKDLHKKQMFKKKKKKKKSFRSIGSIYSYILSHICDSIIFFNPTGVDIHILNIHTISGNVLMIQWPFTFVSKKSR
jgi:hypothetical protein